MTRWLTWSLATLLAGPAAAQTCQLTGTITGIGTKPIIFRYAQAGKLRRDTVHAVNDHFTYVAKPSDDGKVTLIAGTPYQYFWYEPGKLTVSGEAARPGQLTIVGTPENNVANSLQQDIEWKFGQARKAQPTAAASLKEQEQQAVRAFIKAHPNNRTAADALYWQTFGNESLLPEYEQLFKQLTPAVRQSTQGQATAKRLTTLRNQPTIGRPVPEFSVADTVGIRHSLATYRGQYVLLDFWGHWCGPCIQAMPKMQALQKQYAPKLAIIGLAMEDASDAKLWKQAIRQHGVPGLQLSELQQANGPVISGYNVTAFPTYMLLDRQGALLVRSSALDDIAKKLADLADL